MAKPLLFLTGFLGAGKTTLLRSLLIALKNEGRQVDVILNDFANAELDAATLEKHAASVAPIAASCACCDSMDLLISLCLEAVQGEGDLLLIELNGTADPLSLLEAFTLAEEQLPFFPRFQVCVADARHWGTRGEFGSLENRQMETAGFWMLTHADKVDVERAEEVVGSVASVAPEALHITPEQLAEILDSELVAVGAAGEGLVGTDPGVERGGENLKLLKSAGDEVHQLSHRFTGCEVPLPGPLHSREVEGFLGCLPEWVIRVKALVDLTDIPGTRWLYQRSGRDPVPPPSPMLGLRHLSSSIVCIGPCLDPEEVRKRVSDYYAFRSADAGSLTPGSSGQQNWRTGISIPDRD